MHTTQLTHPRLNVLYQLDGGTRTSERELPLDGYRRSRPVRVGNGAAHQLQLDTYGELLQAGWLYAQYGNRLDCDLGRRLAHIADFVCANWRQPDAGIWEVRGEPAHFTQSKMMCAVALDRALQLAEQGTIPARPAPHWRSEHKKSERSSRPAAGQTKRAATAAPPATTRSMRAYCSASCTATPTPQTRVCR
jgi:GH15 family glucan-1,4-alpha-glucosidase